MELSFDIPPGEHLTAFGSTGSGKTFAIKNAVLPWKKRFIVGDSEFDPKKGSYDFTEKAFVICDGDRAARIAAGKKNFRLLVPLKTGEEGFEQVESMCEKMLYGGAHDVAVYLDEITDFADAWSVGSHLEGLIRKARKRNISVYLGSQLPKGVNTWFSSNSRHLLVFGMYEEDANTWSRRLPWLEPILPQIPIGSFKFAYRSPNGSVTLCDPVEEYPWGNVR
jgi:hypothetical protein